MKRTAILILSLVAMGFVQDLNPQPKKITKKFFPNFEIAINTPAFAKKKGFTSYDEMMAFLNNLQKMHPDKMTISFIGSSQKGAKIPFVRLFKKEDKGSIKVWLQGGLHGNEPASTEGVLYLIDRLLNDSKYSYLSQKLDIGIIPMANIDGYEKQDRYAANGLDLNRDQTKLEIPESVILKQAFSDFGAEVALDFHEYRPFRKDFAKMSTFGITSRFDVMFLYSGNLNVPVNLREYTKQAFVEKAELLLDSNGLKHHDYVSTRTVLGDIHFNQGSVNARSSATSYALTNCVSSLIEVRGVGIGRTSFNRRVYTTFLVGISYLESAFKNAVEVKKQIAIANASKDEVVVQSSRDVSKQGLKVIDIETCEEITLEVTIRDAWNSKPKLVRKRPQAYIIHANQVNLISKLKTLGVQCESLSKTQDIEVETYQISEYQEEAEKYEGAKIQNVSTRLEEKSLNFEKGSWIIYMDQSKSNLAAEVLEPEAPNSFVSFGVLKTSKNEQLPIYRYMNSKKL